MKGVVDIKGYLLKDDLKRCGFNNAQLCREIGYSVGVISNSLQRDRMDIALLKHLAERCGQSYTKYLLDKVDIEAVFKGLSTDEKLKAMPTEVLSQLNVRISMELYQRAFQTKEMKRQRFKEKKNEK